MGELGARVDPVDGCVLTGRECVGEGIEMEGLLWNL